MEADRTQPDLQNLSAALPIVSTDRGDIDSADDTEVGRVFTDRTDDAILVSPLTLNEVWSHRTPNEVAVRLLDQLGAINELAICGFHDRSNVEQFAAAAQASDLIGSVTVHEDLTELGLTDEVMKRTAAHPEQRVIPFLLDLQTNRPNDAALKRIYTAEYGFRNLRPYRQQIPSLNAYLGQPKPQLVAVA
jgi:hypothetical protein